MQAVPRWTLVCILAAGAAHALSAAATSDDAPPDRRSINALTIDRSLFERMCDRVRVEGELRAALAESHSAYLAEVSRIEDDTIRAMLEAGFDEHEELFETLNPLNSPDRVNAARNDSQAMEALVEEAERLKDDPRWEQLAELMYEVSSAAKRGQVRIETARTNFMRSFAQAAELSADAEAALERYVLRQLLEPAREPRGMNFIHPTDLFALLDAASESEIIALRDALGEPAYSDLVEPVILQYELQLDAALREQLRSRLAPPERGTPAVRRPGDPGYAERAQELAERWSRRHDITAKAVETIAALMESNLGPEAADQWRWRFISTAAPEIAQPRWPFNMVEWLEAREDATSEQLAHAQRTQEEHRAEFHALVRRLFDAGVELKRIGIAKAEEFPRELDSYARIALEIHTASRRAIPALLSQLNPAQRRALYRLLHDPVDPWHVARLLGPTVDERWLEREGRSDEYIRQVFSN